MNAFLQERPRPLNLAHRGASAYAPENTLTAFRLSAAGLSQVQDLLAPAVARAAKGNNTLGKILAGAAVLGAAAIILTDGDKDDPPSGQSPQRNPDTRQTPQDQPKTPTRPVN